MQENMKCPLCHEEVYSELGEGCKMCGMVLENTDELFCSKECEETYGEIHKSGQ